MKLKSSTLRSFMALHTWVGLATGLLLFIAFYAGAITVFTHELDGWRRPSGDVHQEDKLARAQRLLDQVQAAHPHSHNLKLHLEAAEPVMDWYNEDYSEHRRYRLDDSGQGLTPAAAHGGFIHFIYRLHFTAGLPAPWGTRLFGLACVLYGLALVSGVVIHAPVLLKDLFALRVGHNLKRLWQDAHNVIGLLSLPFHVIFAWSGAVLAIGYLMLAPFQMLVFEGKLLKIIKPDLQTAAHVETQPQDRPLLPLTELLKRGRDQVPGFQPAEVTFHDPGDANAQVTLFGLVDQRMLSRRVAVALNGASGEVQGVDQPSSYSPGKRFLNGLISLHYGNFGDVLLKWMYFVLGLSGAFLFYSGNLLYIESRRRRQQTAQAWGPQLMARLTLGVCLGCIAGVSSLFISGATLPERWDPAVYWAVFFSSLAWAFLRPPARGGHELLWLCAVLTGAVPAAAWLGTGVSPVAALLDGHAHRICVDLAALLLAVAYARLAQATFRRGLNGQPDSVWALPAKGVATA
ncbi:PepSY-associated TM helix domain-containing protein [Roseateles amylovorans]|uniref:PepSY domain-containing protein n=1 Tax=Roseateles amylovorans TaxID=2978473 RepID=A0ABY6ASL8_9BURK|nr:PepSY-associated TM helix domain-containing protein [Roseateles amylovorans]UXH76231.1 PepSY domain-containing protein [Roseateles amylovorans]